VSNYNSCLKWLIFLFFFASHSVFATTTDYQIQGLEGEALKNVQRSLAVLSSENPASFYTQAPDAIKEAIKPFGYFKSTVRLQKNLFLVNTGPLLQIRSVHISIVGDGENDVALKNILAIFPIQKNQALLTENYNKAKAALFNTALAQGYLNPQFITQEILINLSAYTCDITLVLNTGPRYYFGNISFSHTPLSENLLRRYLPFKKGDAFSSQKLLKLQSNLAESNYFEKVLVDNHAKNTRDGYIPISVTLGMKKMRQYLAGLGFGTDTGPRATLGANFRYLNQDGHYITSQAILSSVQNSVGVSYVIPGDNPATDQYSLNETFVANHLNQGSSQTQTLGINYIKMLKSNWQRTYSLNYNIEQFKFNDLPGESSFLLIPEINFTNIRTSQTRIFTNQGNKFSINLQGAARQGFSDNTFFQAEIQDKAITHFTDNDRIIVRGDVGYTYTDSLSALPLSLRFYAGGAQSVRGFSYQALGPGKYIAIGSLEYQHRVINNWYGTVFYDAGNAMDSTAQAFARSAGVGIMWASPMGPLELTLAKAISVPGQPMRIQFVMGPDL
jgi:translocation and assembly module TamA